MRKLVAILLIVFALSGCAMAESDVYDIQGEWYVATIYSNDCYEASLDDDGCFHVAYADGNEMIASPDGVIKAYNEEYKLNLIMFGDGSSLYYTIEGNRLSAELFMQTDGIWNIYDIHDTDLVLIHNGEMIYYNETAKKLDYILQNERLYVLTDTSYLRGKIEPLDQNAFIYRYDAEPHIVTWREGMTTDYGTPYFIYIRSDIE